MLLRTGAAVTSPLLELDPAAGPLRPDDVVELVARTLPDGCKLAVFDHVTSNTAMYPSPWLGLCLCVNCSHSARFPAHAPSVAHPLPGCTLIGAYDPMLHRYTVRKHRLSHPGCYRSPSLSVSDVPFSSFPSSFSFSPFWVGVRVGVKQSVCPDRHPNGGWQPMLRCGCL